MLWMVVTFWCFLVFGCVYAMWRGGTPERRAELSLLAAALLTVAYRTGASDRYSSVDPGVVAIDVGLFAVLIGIALSADRLWPIPVAALQALTLLGHFCKLVNPELWRLGYALMTNAPALPAVLVLIAGTHRHHQRRRGDAVSGS